MSACWSGRAAPVCRHLAPPRWILIDLFCLYSVNQPQTRERLLQSIHPIQYVIEL